MILQILVAAFILLGSAFVTNLFARYMYNRCPDCGTLNARRRSHCRNCQQSLR